MFLQPFHQICGFREVEQCLTESFKLIKGEGLDLRSQLWGNVTYSAGELAENGMDAFLAMTLMRQTSVKSFEVYSQKVRYKTAKGFFLESKGEMERQPMSLEELVVIVA